MKIFIRYYLNVPVKIYSPHFGTPPNPHNTYFQSQWLGLVIGTQSEKMASMVRFVVPLKFFPIQKLKK